MNLLDLVIGVALVAAAVNGFRRGASLQIASYTGLLGGLFLGALLAPQIAEVAQSSMARALIALFVLVGAAGLGDAVGWLVGSRIWVAARRGALGEVDSALGSVVAVVAGLLAVWYLAFNLVNGPIPPLARQIRASVVLQTLDAALPRPPSLLAQARRLMNRFGFPDVFEGIPPAPAGPVDEPSDAQIRGAVRTAAPSTVKIVGRGCGGIQEGSGYVATEDLVVTNAHVVAGIDAPVVQHQNGASLPAVPVLFDPDLDIAILRVEGGLGAALALDTQELDRGVPGAVLGYPGGGDLEAGTAAVRRRLTAIGRDIYGRSTVERDVYELQAEVRPGNSGGPFIDTEGEVAGVVFAASTTDGNVGYAILAAEVQPRLERAQGRSGPVSTGSCA